MEYQLQTPVHRYSVLLKVKAVDTTAVWTNLSAIKMAAYLSVKRRINIVEPNLKV
jgi:hypothetical protein